MLSHLIDKESWHGSVWVLCNHILDFSSNYIPAAVLSCYGANEVDLDIRIDIISYLCSHRLRHCFIATSTVAKSVVVIWSILLKVVAYYGASRRNKRHRWTNSLMCNHTSIIRHNICDCQDSWACNLLDPLLIFRCKPLEVFRSHTFEVDQLDKNRHFTIPGLMDYSLHTLIFNHEWNCFTLVDEANGVVD